MKKNLFVVLFILSNLAFSQNKEYDIYVEYRYVGGIDPYNGNVSIGVGNVIEFNEFFQSLSSPPSAFTRGGILANTTMVDALPWNASLDFGLYSSSDNGMVSLGINGKSDFHISGQGFSWSARILLLEKIKISAPEGRRCFKDKITVQASKGHPTEAYTWLYSAKGYDEQEFASSSSSINVSLEDLYPDPNDQLNLIDEVITFRLYNSLNDYSHVATYIWSDCSIELRYDDYIQYTNPTCFKGDDDGESNGTVSLNFKGNVDEAGGWEMRYFIFQGKPEDLNIDPMDSTPPQVYGGVRFSPKSPDNPSGAGYLTYNEIDGSYSGTYIGLEGINSGINPPPDELNQQDYFIVYQEVKYFEGTATVKSGEIVPSFTIRQPTQVTLNTSDPKFYTPASCGNPAIFNFNNIATGGDNLDPGGSYSFEYSMDNGTSWKSVDISNNILKIEAIEGQQQTVEVRGIYNIRGTGCSGERYKYTILPVIPPVVFSNPIASTTSTAEASDGSVRVGFSGGFKPYLYSLTKFNSDTDTFEFFDSNPNTIDTPGGPEVSFDSLPIGTYRIIIKYNNKICSQGTADLIVGTDPIPILGNPTVMQMGCEGSYASISVPITDFNDKYRYQWIINGVASAIQTGSNPTLVENSITTPGLHTLRVSNGEVSDADFNNDPYISSTMVEIDNPSTVTITNVIPNTTQCEDSNDGSITLTATGGISYEYSLDFFPNETDWIPLTDNTITDLAPGRYRVTIRNQDGCESESLENIIVEEAPIIEVITTKTDATIYGGNEGTITLNITGGSPFSEPSYPYIISWEKDGTTYVDNDTSTPNFINELGAGEYTVTVTDANNCDNTISITITEPGPLTILSFNGTASCSELDNGTLTATAQGTGQLIFNWILNDGSPTGTLLASTPTMDGTASLEGLSLGTYSLNIIEVDSGNEVNSDQDFIIEEASLITATIAITKSSCGIPNSGTILISNVSGGTPFPSGSGYEYHINDSFNNYQSDPEFINLPPRTYIVTIRDVRGCEYNETVEITQAGAPVLDQTNTVLTNPTDISGADGAITLAFIGDASNYSYEWTGSGIDGVTSKDVTGLVAGDYQVTVSAPGACILVTSFSIVDPVESETLVATISKTVLLKCNGDDFAEITANVQEGTAPYTYEWFQIVNGSSLALSGDTGIIEGLTVGTYFLQVTDANNNIVNTSPLTITQPDTLTIHVDEVKDILCSGEVTGAINVSVAGGTAPYSYIWSNGEIDQNLSNIGAGEYTLEVMDANACFTEITVTVNNAPNSIQITNVSIINVSDYKANNGSITVGVAGGSTPYNINWTRQSDNASLGNQGSISNLSSDTYQISIIDANGCSIIENYEVSQPDIVDETIVQPSCSGDSNGSISVLVNQGNGNFTYNWNTGATTTAINNLTVGSYTVTISGLGNDPLNRTYVIEDPLPLEVDLGETRTLCGGQELVLGANVEDVTASYSWTSDTGFTSTLPTITLTEGGTYTVTITSQNGCSATGSVLVEVSEEEINAEFAMSSQVFTGESLMVIDLSFPFPESLEWVIPDGVTIVRTTTDEAELIFNEAGEYEVGIIIKIGDCSAQRFKKVLVVANENNEVVDINNDSNKQLEDFIIYPNPTNGKFTADITLSKRGNISIKVFNFANNALMASAKEGGSTSYSVPFDISGLPAGVYAVVLETPFGNSLRKVILK
ncbi:T9SS type A sorting domain-containing protein [Arenibacter certesii]|uniref:Secretion system C-terminal sorting domain-containing protein n=1 Tax=Arenibacter certesii TaxID=228955 RepID=A0A918J605_9FLAO|nr:T9SS type A sorting domain-containing protein [Arenibacter certesii]GGW50701.1 hypothetical protein GCM10007383_38050 [Arenibacter certesii]